MTVPVADEQKLLSAAQRAGLLAIRHPEWNSLHLPATTVTADVPPAATVQYSTTALHIVQFDSPLTADDVDSLHAVKATYIGYLPYNAVLVAATSEAMKTLKARRNVAWTAVFDPAFRSRPAGWPRIGTRPVVVQVARAAGSENTTNEIQRTASAIHAINPVGPYLNIYADLTADAAAKLITDPLVVGINDVGELECSGEREAIAITGFSQAYWNDVWQNGVQPLKVSADYRTWLSNRGVLNTSAYRIAFVDSGLDASAGNARPNHPDLMRANLIRQSYTPTGNPEDPADGYGHGTLVAGIAVGNPAVSAPADRDPGGFLYGMGIAPQTGIYAQKIVRNDGVVDSSISLMTLADDSMNLGCAVQNHSQNDTSPGLEGYYTARSQEMDYAIRDTNTSDSADTPMPMTVSAGNARAASTNLMVTAPATAKNAIVVGASQSWRPSEYATCTTAGERTVLH